MAMAICPIIVHFSTWRARSMHDVACDFARTVVRSKDAQKQLARTSFIQNQHLVRDDFDEHKTWVRDILKGYGHVIWSVDNLLRLV